LLKYFAKINLFYNLLKKENNMEHLELQNAEKGKVVMRFAPNPSGFLHIGHARAAFLNDILVKKYSGKLILRIEDTDPKRVDISAYKGIEEDLRWMGIEWHEKYLQSDRIQIYIEHAKTLIEKGFAYACNCPKDEFRNDKIKSMPCIHRNSSVDENLKKFNEMMVDGSDGWSIQLKTDLHHPNPALRDFPILRVSDFPHPRQELKENKIYPLMNFSVTVDDHLMGITHVLRGKDHITNTERQKFIYNYLNWKTPYFIHYGIMHVNEKISKSNIKKGIKEGIYTGWDDVNLLTIRALKRRGIRAEAIRKYIADIGMKEIDIKFSEENLYAENKKFIENSPRYFFVSNPVELIVEDFPEMTAEFPLHKEIDLGSRIFNLKPEKNRMIFYISEDDKKKLKENTEIRLMNLCNIKINKIEDETEDKIYNKHSKIYGNYIPDSIGPMVKISGKAGEKGKFFKVQKILWLPKDNTISAKILVPKMNVEGVCEANCGNLKVDDIIQFEAFGFCRVDEIDKSKETIKKIIFYFTHR